MNGLRFVETLAAVLCVVFQQLTRRELRTIGGRISLHVGHDAIGAEAIHETEHTSSLWRESWWWRIEDWCQLNRAL